MAFAPVYPHGPLETIGENVFMVRGSIRMNPVIRITRNMAIVREGDELTLINPVRVDESTLADIDRLGTVHHVLRLGAFHGIDDPFYMDRYRAKFWSYEGGTTYTEPPIDEVMTSGGALPFGNASLFTFEGANQPEGAILINEGRGLLLTTDAIQHYGDYSYNNLPARLMMPFIGFPRTTIVGPIWLKLMTPAGHSLGEQFAHLLELSFDRLLAAHGTLLEADAHGAVTVAVRRAFKEH